MKSIKSFFLLPHGVPRVGDRRFNIGTVFVIRNDLHRRDAPPADGPHKTRYNRIIRWSRLGVFDRIFAGLAGHDLAKPVLTLHRSPLRK